MQLGGSTFTRKAGRLWFRRLGRKFFMDGFPVTIMRLDRFRGSEIRVAYEDDPSGFGCQDQFSKSIPAGLSSHSWSVITFPCATNALHWDPHPILQFRGNFTPAMSPTNMLANQGHHLIFLFSPNQKIAICSEVPATQPFIFPLNHNHPSFSAAEEILRLEDSYTV
jgi:hypothetical protein